MVFKTTTEKVTTHTYELTVDDLEGLVRDKLNLPVTAHFKWGGPGPFLLVTVKHFETKEL